MSHKHCVVPKRRKALSVSASSLIEVVEPESGSYLPLLFRPRVNGVNLAEWAESNSELITQHLLKHGAILCRGFDVTTVRQFESFVGAVSGQLIEYTERTSPRSIVSGHVYTSTDYPADQSIFFHNENSYQSSWPMKLFFSCAVPAETGGATPIADCRRVLRHIHQRTLDRFERNGWMYIRNFGEGLGMSWQTAFQTSHQSDVEGYCKRAGIETEWRGADRLRTRQIRPAVRHHPRTGEMVWFNHVVFFHISTLPPGVRGALLSEFDESEVPNNTYYGDGSPIEAEVVEEIRQAYLRCKTSFPWEAGDMLMLDNMLTAHSRDPFSGPRKIWVGMSEPLSPPIA